MEPMSPRARELLDAVNRAESPTAETEQWVWEQIEARAAAGDLGPALPRPEPGPPSGARSFLTLAKWLGPALLGGGLIVGGIKLAGVSGSGQAVDGAHDIETAEADDAPDDAPVDAPASAPAGRTYTVDRDMSEDTRPLPADEEETTGGDATREPAVVPDTIAKPERSKRPHRGPENRRQAASASGDQPTTDDAPLLGPEMKLMARARRELAAGDARAALELLDRHAREFPRGVFVRERKVSQIEALCSLGRVRAARRQTRAFLRQHGDSPLAARVRSTCGDVETAAQRPG